MSIAPAVLVAGPARQPLPYGLFSVLTPRSSTDTLWTNGIEWESVGTSPVSGIGEPECDPSETLGLPKTFVRGGSPLGSASPFTVYGSYVCNPIGNTLTHANENAEQSLLSREEARVEQAVWEGDLGNRGLVNDPEDLSGSAVASPATAIGTLEAWLGSNYGSLGVIHMTRIAATTLIKEGVVEVKGSTLQTVLGTPVVAGSGYTGNGPEGEEPAEGSEWIYATGALIGYRGDVFTSTNRPGDLLDRGSNDLYAVAERTYVIGWDEVGPAAVLVNVETDV